MDLLILKDGLILADKWLALRTVLAAGLTSRGSAWPVTVPPPSRFMHFALLLSPPFSLGVCISCICVAVTEAPEGNKEERFFWLLASESCHHDEQRYSDRSGSVQHGRTLCSMVAGGEEPGKSRHSFQILLYWLTSASQALPETHSHTNTTHSRT